MEGNKIENLTKKELKVKIFELIELMGEKEASLSTEIFQKSIKSDTKEKYINFYYELTEGMELETVLTDENDDDN